MALEHCGHINAESIREYIAMGGYSAVAKALFDMTPEGIVKEISEAGLRGRGGGGFPQEKNGSRCCVSPVPINMWSATEMRAIRARSWTAL